jgi:hypothetical protein
MSDKKIEDMTVFEQSRWYALLEAINIIADECDARGKNFEKIKISPLDVEKYIEGTCDIFARKIYEEQRLQSPRKNMFFDLYHISTVKDDKMEMVSI